MIYDCILFNDELDMLKLRLTYMSNYIDYFVIGESTQTYSGLEKPLYFLENIHQFSQFKDKIIHVTIPPMEGLDCWEKEFYQRNFLKVALKNCLDNDLIIIADIDELINMDYLLNEYKITKTCILKIPLYYYFLNLKTSIDWQRTLITPFSYIKNIDIGDRLKYLDLNPTILKGRNHHLGWHFSYLFGYDIKLYISKLKSFSHQEYNTSYFLDSKRIMTCLNLGVDFLERNSVYHTVNLTKELSPQLLDALHETGLISKFTYQKPGILFYLNFYNLKYFIKFNLKPTLKKQLIALKLMGSA